MVSSRNGINVSGTRIIALELVGLGEEEDGGMSNTNRIRIA
jgi:hypothetical protein